MRLEEREATWGSHAVREKKGGHFYWESFTETSCRENKSDTGEDRWASEWGKARRLAQIAKAGMRSSAIQPEAQRGVRLNQSAWGEQKLQLQLMIYKRCKSGHDAQQEMLSPLEIVTTEITKATISQNITNNCLSFHWDASRSCILIVTVLQH